MDGELVEVGDVTLFVRQLGERRPGRPTLVVLHGGPDVGHSYLLPGLRPLARDHHVVTFDFRGCGRSSRGLPDDALQPEHVVEDARRLLDLLGLAEVDLLGFSAGGRAAMRFVDEHPGRVRRLVLASTTAYTGEDVDRHLRGWDEYHRRRRIEAAAGGALRGSTIAVWNLDLAPAYLEMISGLDGGDWSYQRFLDGRMHPWCPRDPEQILRGWGGPVLVLHGAKDMGFPVQVARRLHDAVPGSELAVVEDAAHMCHFEKPETWAGYVRDFLARGDPAGGPAGRGTR